jgi:hypothetical protein
MRFEGGDVVLRWGGGQVWLICRLSLGRLPGPSLPPEGLGKLNKVPGTFSRTQYKRRVLIRLIREKFWRPIFRNDYYYVGNINVIT